MSGSKRAGVITEEEQTEQAVITSVANLVLKIDHPRERLLIANRAAKVMRNMVLTNKTYEEIVAAIGQRAIEIGSSKFASADEAKVAKEIAEERSKESTAAIEPSAPVQEPAKEPARNNNLTAVQANYIAALEEAGKTSKKPTAEHEKLAALMNNPVSVQIH